MSQYTLQFQCLAENAYCLKDSPKKDFYLYIVLQGGAAPKNNKRIPLNISLVIDRSGSMAGDKLNYVKKAVDFVIDNLSAEDILSILQYDDLVEVLSASAKVTNKAELHRLVQKIQDRNSTNLSGGMLEGYNQVALTLQKAFVNRVLLLSDGLANVGIVDPAQLQQIAQKKFREESIGLSTFGVGADFNEILMTNLSEYGGANYYFIDKPDQIPQIFAQELEGLLAVVAQNTHLKVKFPAKQVRCEKVYGYPFTVSQHEISINFNDVFAEEKKAVLIKFEVLGTLQEGLHFEADLEYDDVVNIKKIQEKASLSIPISPDEKSYTAGVNPIVIEQTALFVANDLFEEAIRHADKHDMEAAKKTIAQIKTYLDTYFKIIVPGEELKKQYQQILDYEQQLEQMVYMSSTDYLMAQKTSRSESYKLRKKK
ncbi:MAG: VWA domain-containing protein [Microscillaceae bacterium]|nr:VWA domain-containing protein [Microscillaceae bacterium]